jgi:hypothetical protein
VAITRCTCIYRASTSAEQKQGAATISVSMPDPWCPAAEVHTRNRISIAEPIESTQP